MSYIVPDGVIQLFKNIPLAPNNENTLYFSSVADKDAFFYGLQNNEGYSLGSWNDCTYSREQRGFVRINTQMGSVYNATYMRFKNSSFENKWFYAFVTSVEYVANKTVQINYTLDVIMTYMGNFTLKECFIERETVANDKIGKNILDEGLNIGTYVNEADALFNTLHQNEKIVIVVADPNEMGGGGASGGVYCPSIMKAFDTPAAANTYITQIVDAGLESNILGVFMLPYDFKDAATNATHMLSQRKVITKPYTNVNGYAPKNNKLFVYPYKRLLVDNFEGNQQEYRWEYFNSDGGTGDDSTTATFVIYCTLLGSCELMALPLNYKMGFRQGDNFSAGITKTHFPECAWAFDTYKAYRAQVNASLALDIAQGAVQGGFSGLMSGITEGGDIPLIGNIVSGVGGATMGALTGGVKPALDALLVNTFDVEKGTTTKGSQSPNTLFGIGYTTFIGYSQCVDGAHAAAIDDYFTMYGYKVNKVATPNMNIRPYFTYVKTQGCIAAGEIPADYLRVIEGYFNNGVRFWKDFTNFGNYAVANTAPVR